jgi:dienelactone hydrolase
MSDREGILAEIKKKKVVYSIPGMDDVRVVSTAYDTGHEDLAMDIYYPPGTSGTPPVVVVPFGYPDPSGRIRQYGPMTSWARLIAASGMATVIYGTNECAENVHAVVKHLRANADALRLDGERLGLWATSASVSVALSALMRDPSFKCAALLYGYTMDLDGSPAVAAMAREYQFTDACAGKSVDDLPDNVPMLFIRAGREQFPGLNEALDRVVAKAVARNLPVTFVNHATGTHGFDLDDDSETSRRMIRQVLSFLQSHLGLETGD